MNLSDEYKQVPLFFNIIYWRIPIYDDILRLWFNYIVYKKWNVKITLYINHFMYS